jgi:NAD(P)-dependent dehydrogenase (short-subunit alcohol dehydrogenase family)
MDIEGSVALVTGGNRGLGKAFVQALLDAGTKKIYVGARRLTEVTDSRLHPLKLDITNPSDIAAVLEVCQDVTILINNAGILYPDPLFTAPSLENARKEMETNYLGTLAMCQAFAPILKKNGGGVLANMLSITSWYPGNPRLATYSASKAAQWSLTNSIRMELRAQKTLVIGIYAGLMDTDMIAWIDRPKGRPEDVAAKTIAGILAGDEEILADQRSVDLKATLLADPQSYYQEVQERWDQSRQ